MSPRNPLRDEGQPTDQQRGEQTTGSHEHDVIRILLPDGSVREVFQRGHFSGMNQNGVYVDTGISGANFDHAGNPIPSDLSNCSVSLNGYIIPQDKLGQCTSILHPRNRSRNVFLGLDGWPTSGGTICSVCQSRKVTIYITLGILGLGVILGVYRGVGFF